MLPRREGARSRQGALRRRQGQGARWRRRQRTRSGSRPAPLAVPRPQEEVAVARAQKVEPRAFQGPQRSQAQPQPGRGRRRRQEAAPAEAVHLLGHSAGRLRAHHAPPVQGDAGNPAERTPPFRYVSRRPSQSHFIRTRPENRSIRLVHFTLRFENDSFFSQTGFLWKATFSNRGLIYL